MFYNQPLATRFGTDLLRHIDPFWDKLDIAVAWVRASGMSYLTQQLTNFLRGGGEVSIVVGIDLLNTTREGLEALLALEPHGCCETYVYHNEAQSVFHPKLYLFRNEEEARLIVGSNNITEAGLYVNVEAGLQTDVPVNSPTIVEVVDALASWKDTATGLSFRLDAALLNRLVTEGYVPDEATARAQLRRVRQRQGAGPRRLPIFASRTFSPPPTAVAARAAAFRTRRPRQAAAAAPQAQQASAPFTGNVLLMRLRRASASARRTQVQIPIRLLNVFFAGVNHVTSTHSGVSHNIIRAQARGITNTIKMEMPEINNFAQPLARFENTPAGMVYQVYDVGSAQGNQILGSLQQGIQDGSTQMSISDANRATWWRFI